MGTLEQAFRLRMTAEERQLVEAIRAEGRAAGLAPSLNDAIRHMIRRRQLPDAYDLTEARAASMGHFTECPDCGPLQPARCLDGLYLFKRQLEYRKRRTPRRGGTRGGSYGART